MPVHGDHGDEGEGPQPCDEGKCVFASGMARMVIDSPLAAADFAATKHALSEAGSGVHLAVAECLERPGGLALCIMHQRLLI